MSAPGVCPSCSRLIPSGAASCPSCGWVDPGPHARHTKEIPNQASVRLARIGLVKLDPTLPLELPPDEGAPLELPPEEPTAAGELDAEPVTNPYAKGFTLPAAAGGGRDVGATTAPYSDFAFPPDALSSGPQLAIGAVTTPLSMDFTIPEDARPSGATPAPAATAPAPGPSLSGPTPAPFRGPRLDLPPEDSQELPPPSAPRPPRSSAPRLEVVKPLPTWLTDPLADARVSVPLCAGFLALTLVDLVVAGRAEVPTTLLGVQLVFGAATGVACFFRQRAALAFVVGAIGVSAFASPRVLVEAVMWGVPVAVTSVIALRRPWRRALGAMGWLALGTAVVPVLDGITPRPVLGAFARDGAAVEWPLVDQVTGLQLLGGPSTVRQLEGQVLRLVDPVEGASYVGVRLRRGHTPASASTEAKDWVERTFENVTFGDAVARTGPYDSVALVPFSAADQRARLRGLAQIFLIGDEAFVVIASTRAHRFERLEPTFISVLEQARYRVPRRPRLSGAAAERVRASLLRSTDGLRVGARVTLGERTVAVIVGATSGLVTFDTAQGRVPIELTSAVDTAGVVSASIAGGPAVSPTAARDAPRLTRLVVMAAQGWTGGWLSTEPSGDVSPRPVELFEGKEGPAFTLDGQLLGVVIGGALVPCEALASGWKTLTGNGPALTPGPQTAPPLYEPRARPSSDPEVSSIPSESVLLARSAGGSASAVVIDARRAHWVLVTDERLAPPGTTAVTMRLPSGATRAAEPVRAMRGLALLTLPRDPDDRLTPLRLAEGAPAGRRLTWGFRNDAAARTQVLTASVGELVADDFELDPGLPLSGGPVMTPDGTVAAFRRTDGLPPVFASTMLAVQIPGVRDVVWRLAAEASGTCQLAATVFLEDPLGAATLVRLRAEPVSSPEPTRLTSAAIVDARPERGEATLLHRAPCSTSPAFLQFEVQSDEGVRLTRLQRLAPPPTLPGLVRGRTGPSPGASAAPASAVSVLWDVPAPVTMNHPCAKAPALCERACAVDELTACTLDGREALTKRETQRAFGPLDQMCAKGELEACVLLSFALEGARPKGRLVADPRAALLPWCRAGLVRACAALAPKEWQQRLVTVTRECSRTPTDCRALGRHLLDGPRLDPDLQLALASFKKACAAGDLEGCADHGDEGLRSGALTPLAALPFVRRACEGGVARACVLEALDPALGLTVPKNDLAVEALIRRACQLSDAAACAMVPAPPSDEP